MAWHGRLSATGVRTRFFPVDNSPRQMTVWPCLISTCTLSLRYSAILFLTEYCPGWGGQRICPSFSAPTNHHRHCSNSNCTTFIAPISLKIQAQGFRIFNSNRELIPDRWHNYRKRTFANVELSFRNKIFSGKRWPIKGPKVFRER